MPSDDFHGLKVLAFESRRASEIAKLIISYGGEPTIVPALREVPLESNQEARTFVSVLLDGKFDVVIFLTGVGACALFTLADAVCGRAKFVAALARTRVVARGPKPIAALREIGLSATIAVPEPNTWRELLHALDDVIGRQTLAGLRIAVQEYGVPNADLVSGLQERGALVTQVPIYRWALPEDTGPLRQAVRAVAEQSVDVVLFTTGVQVTHLFEVAKEIACTESLRSGLQHTVVASIGPSTSETLRRFSLNADIEPSHPKMGFLVKETAERSAELHRRKRP